MKRHLRLLIAIIMTVAALPFITWHGTAQNNNGQQPQARDNGQTEKFHRSKRPVRESYIVVLANETPADGVEAVANDFLAKHGGTAHHLYKSTIKGFSIQLPEAAAMALSRDPRVDYVEEDTEASFSRTDSTGNWNLTRIDQRTGIGNSYYLPNVEDGAGVNAYILDTGIKAAHREFQNRASADADLVWWNNTGGDDCFGHGTAVAGILGGRSVGAAQGVRLRGVRIGDCVGFTMTSTIIAGVDWVTANHINPAVVNMSFEVLADPIYGNSLEDAIRRSIAQGVTYVAAAGNGNTDVRDVVPARMPEVITVGATNDADQRASFSNFGAGIDLFAPGVGVRSASNIDLNGNGIFDDSTGLIDGTSFSAPLAAGVVARFLQVVPNAAPAAAQGAILNSATLNVLGNLGPGSPNRLLFSELRHAFLGRAIRSIGESSTNVDAGVFLNPGQWLAMSGIGEIWSGVPFTSNNGPQGWNTIENNPSFPLPGSRPYSLIGRLEGFSNAYIGASNATTQSVSGPTRLFLRTNDNILGDGNGAFLCKTELWKVLPDARADYVDMSVPAFLLPGATWPVWVTMTNVGPTTWTAGQGFKLASQGDSMTWGINRVVVPNDVPPGTSVTFSFNITAPTVPGTYSYQWRMLQEGVQRFGDTTINMPITVVSLTNQAEFVSQTVPKWMYATESYTVSVTMKNTGNTVWNVGSTYKLGSQNLQDNTRWGLNRVEMPRNVFPGEAVIFTFEVTAPLKTGNNNFQWRMVQDGVEWFGATTPNVIVSVKAPPCQYC
jgi:Subtilase family/Ig-like domain from next to BRCA1 gene/Peptidase inhibitor I9